MKKIGLLIVSLLLLTGCEAVYNVNINDNKIDDELIINAIDNINDENIKSLIDKNYETFNLAVDYNTPGYPEIRTKLDGYDYYHSEKINNSEIYGIKYNYSFNMDKYKNSYVLVPFNYLKIINNSRKFSIDSGDAKGNSTFKTYPYLDKLTINITTNYVVNSNNADKVNNNTYTWIFTKNNYENKVLKMEIDKTQKRSILEDKIIAEKISKYFFIGLGISILLAGLIIFIKVRNSNK